MQKSQNLIYRSIVMIGATGAVGGEVVKNLKTHPQLNRLTLLGRRKIPNLPDVIDQPIIDVTTPTSYQEFLAGHDTAICTLGVGQPSKVSKEDFLKIDKTAVLDFATACKKAGVQHFELLSSVGISADSSSFFLRSKGELVEELKALQFERLSIFQPSMILTPTNRYGFGQAVTLAVWPLLKPVLFGGLKKYRGVRVEDLGKAIALNIFEKGEGVEVLTWKNFQELSKG